MNSQLSRLSTSPCNGLRIGCSTTELPRPFIIKDLFRCLAPCVQLAFHFHGTLWVSAQRDLTSNGKCTNRSEPSCALLTGDRRASETLTLSRRGQQNPIARQIKKDSKLILTLSDSFRKVLILRVLASTMAFNCRWPEKRRQQREAILTITY